MTIPLLPAPDSPENTNRQANEDQRGQAEQAQRKTHAGTSGRIASEEECLSALTQLPGMVLMKMVNPTQANSMRSIYMAILQHHRDKRNAGGRSAVVDDAMLEVLSRHPELANMLEAFLSAEQIATILARAEERSHGTT